MDSRVQVARMDALKYTSAPDGCLDIIIADPPWNFYEDTSDITPFYRKIIREFGRVLRKNGKMVLSPARTDELGKAVSGFVFFMIEDVIDALVNGKKAALFVIKPLKADGLHRKKEEQET